MDADGHAGEALHVSVDNRERLGRRELAGGAVAVRAHAVLACEREERGERRRGEEANINCE